MKDKQQPADQIALQIEPPIVIDCANGGKVVLNNHHHHNELNQNWTSKPKLSPDGSTLTFESDGQVDVVVSLSKKELTPMHEDPDDTVEILYVDGHSENRPPPIPFINGTIPFKLSKLSPLNQAYVMNTFSQILTNFTSTGKTNRPFVSYTTQAIATVSAVQFSSQLNPNPTLDCPILTDKQTSIVFHLNQAVLLYASNGFEIMDFVGTMLDAIVTVSAVSQSSYLGSTAFSDSVDPATVPLLPQTPSEANSAPSSAGFNHQNIYNYNIIGGDKNTVNFDAKGADVGSDKKKDKKPSCLKRFWKPANDQQIVLQNESNNLTESEPPIVIDCDNGGKVVINNHHHHHNPNQLQTWTSKPKLSSDGSTLTFESDGQVNVVVSISKSNQIDYPSDEDHVEILYTDGPPENPSPIKTEIRFKATKITALNKDYVTSAFSQLLAFHTTSTDKPNQAFVCLINEAIATVSAVKCANDQNAPPLTDLLTDKQASTLYCLNQALLNFASSGFEVKQFGALLLEAIVIASSPETGSVDDAEESNVQESSPLLPAAQPSTTINKININNHGNGNKTIVDANGAVTDSPFKKDKDKEPSCLKRTWDYVCKPFIACSKCIPCCTCLTAACV